jgi:transposase
MTRADAIHEQSVKVVYVDICCNVYKVARKCFPGALVKLDAFHWLKRWGDVLQDAKTG